MSYWGSCLPGQLSHWDSCRTWTVVVPGQLSAWTVVAWAVVVGDSCRLGRCRCIMGRVGETAASYYVTRGFLIFFDRHTIEAGNDSRVVHISSLPELKNIQNIVNYN